jgi:hypothetical protein
MRERDAAMPSRKSTVNQVLNNAIERGADLATAAIEGTELDALFAASQEHAAKLIGQIPISAPSVDQLKTRAAEGAHHAAQNLHNRVGAFERATPRRKRSGRLAFVAALVTGATISLWFWRRHKSSETTFESDGSAVHPNAHDNSTPSGTSQPSTGGVNPTVNGHKTPTRAVT